MFWRKKKPKYETPQLTDANFNEMVANSELPVLIDFYADWCGPCKVLGPIIDELADEYQGRALVAKVNTEINPGLSQHFKIKSIPTMLVLVLILLFLGVCHLGGLFARRLFMFC